MECPESAALKVIILGEASVGKTSILNQWLHGTFTPRTSPTIAAGLSPVQLMVDGAVQSFHVWDTAGTPQFRSVVPMYCRSAAIAVIVFDLTMRASFDRVEEWHSFVRETAEPAFIIVGNKIDLVEDREIDTSEAEELAKKLGCTYIEVSACTGDGMNFFGRAILACARDYNAKRIMGKEPPTPQPEDINTPTKCKC
jgi:small GTP-binding protein